MTLEDQINLITQELSHTEEKYNLLSPLSSRVIEIFTRNNAFIAGGAVTSVFSSKPIKDFDIFFKNEESYFAAVKELNQGDNIERAKTVNALTYRCLDNCGYVIQLIKLPSSFKENPIEIFEEFDFTVCCGLYDFQLGGFKFHRDFLKHVAQRKLIFNTKHRFPISSLLRSQKYKDKGYTLDQGNLLKIVISIASLDIKTNADAAKQFQGMYLGEYRAVFEPILKDESPFQFDKFLDVIKDMTEKPYTSAKNDKSNPVRIPIPPIVVESFPF